MKLCNYTPQLIRGLSRILYFPSCSATLPARVDTPLFPELCIAPFYFLRHCVISGIVSSWIEQKQPVILEVGLECDVSLRL